MIDQKKIIITGPPGTGKTTIQKVYFELANPVRLLENSLEPSRGITTSVFGFFTSQLSIFDLAGQENDDWFGERSHVYSECDMIICVLDIRKELKVILEFIKKVYSIKKELKLYDCKIVVLLHKIDLVKIPFAINKHKSLMEIIKTKHKDIENCKIYRTSIADEYFIKTYYVFSEILIQIYSLDLIPISRSEFNNLKKEFLMIINLDESCLYNRLDLASKFNLSNVDMINHLERLRALGFIYISEKNPSAFGFTERAKLFKRNLEKEKSKANERILDKKVDLYYTFSNLRLNKHL